MRGYSQSFMVTHVYQMIIKALYWGLTLWLRGAKVSSEKMKDKVHNMVIFISDITSVLIPKINIMIIDRFVHWRS